MPEVGAQRIRKNLLSATFAIDGVATITVTTAHGLGYTPNNYDVSVTVIQNSAVDDWAYGFVKIVSVDATNIVVKVRVTTASATVGATAYLGIKIG